MVFVYKIKVKIYSIFIIKCYYIIYYINFEYEKVINCNI